MASSRLTRDDWIAIARKALIASGIDDVKVDVLARRLKVSRGSFYWHFKHRQELLDALRDDWEANNRHEIALMTNRVSDGPVGLAQIFQIWLGEDPSFPAFDLAIRVWARKSRKVAKIVGDIDEAWVGLLQSFFERAGVTAPESFVRARIMYFHQVGYYALAINESLEDRVKLAPFYFTALTGAPAPAELSDILSALPARKKVARAAPKKKALAKKAVAEVE